MSEYLCQNVWQIWVFLAILSLIIELSSGTFYILCFAIGAAVSAVVAAVGGGFVAQKYLHGHTDGERVSNADALIGREGRVSETISAGGYGRVAIDGDDWKALSKDGAEILKDEKVKVVDRESIIITVEKI